MCINKTLFKQSNAPLPTDKTTYPQFMDALLKIAHQDANSPTWGWRIANGWPQWRADPV